MNRFFYASGNGTTLLIAAVVGSALVATAQPTPGNRPERRPSADEFRRGERPQPRIGASFVPGLERLFGVLTDEQRASFRDVMEGQRDKMRDLEEKIRDARKGLLEASLTKKFDKEAIEKKALAAAKLEAQRSVLLAEAFSKMRPRLTEEQIEKIKNPPPFQPGEGRPEFRPGDREGRPPRDGRRPERDANDLPAPPKP
jgi:Spy/CpxP family protein refolding chaperone